MTSDEFGDIERLDENLRKWFKEKWVRFGPDGKIRGACARGDDSEGKPKCLPQKKAQNLGKKGRKYAASKKRREDPNPERTGKAKNVATKKKTNEDIPFNECPSCRGPIVHESMMNEKQDACYHKVKSRYKVWPSAYASGALVQCRKKGASNWGTGGKKSESSIMKGIVDEASGTPGGLERFRTPAMVNATMQQSLYKRELAPIKAAEKKRKEAEYRKNNPSVSVPSIQIGASQYPIHVIHNWIGSKDLNAAVEFAVNKFAYRQSKDFKTEIAGDPDFQKAVKNFFNVAEKSLNHRDSTRTKSHWDGKIRAAPRETDTSSDGFDAINKINDALLPYYKKYGVDKTGRRVPPNFNYALGEAKAKQYVKPYNDPQTGEQIGWKSSDGYHVKYWQMFAKDSAIKHAKLNPNEVDEAVDPNLGYDPNDYDDDFEEIPLQTATHITTQDIPMQRGGDLPAGTELKMHKRSSDPGPDTRARFHFFAVLDNGNPTRLVRLPKKLVKSVTMHEDYTGEFAAEKTPAINPYGGLKDNQFRGAISETPTDNPTGTSGEGGQRTYRPKSAGRLDETTHEYDADELLKMLGDYQLSKPKGDPSRGVATRIMNALHYYKGGKVTRVELLRSPGMGKQGMVLIDTLLGRTNPSTDPYAYFQSQIIEYAEHLKNAIAKQDVRTAEDLLSKLKSALNALKRSKPAGQLDEEYLDEGLMQKIGAAAMAAALAFGGAKANAEPVYVYTTGDGSYQTVLSPEEIPTNAIRRLIVDTENDDVSLLSKTGTQTPIQLDTTMVNRIKQRAGIGQAKSTQPQAAAQQSATPKNIKQNQSQPAEANQFSIKGIKFGMAPAEVDAVTGGKGGKLPNSFTIGNDSGWEAEYDNDKLVAIRTYSPAAGAYQAINNKFGYSDQNFKYSKSYGEKAEGKTQIAIWNEPGVSITMYFPYKDILDRWKGLSMTAFEDPNFKKRKAEKENQKTQQANKDLEEDTAYAGGMGQGGNAGESYRKFKPKSAGTFKEDELDEACWKGYHKEGNKKMFGKTYPNCVKNTNEEEQIDESFMQVSRINRVLKKNGFELYNDNMPGDHDNSVIQAEWHHPSGRKISTFTPNVGGGLLGNTYPSKYISVKLHGNGGIDEYKESTAEFLPTSPRDLNRYLSSSNSSKVELDEKCWDTHKQVGMKNKGGRQVPNCVPKESAIMKGINRLT